MLLSEVSQKEKGKYHMISLTCGILKKKQMNFLQNRNRLRDIENKGERWGDTLRVWG